MAAGNHAIVGGKPFPKFPGEEGSPLGGGNLFPVGVEPEGAARRRQDRDPFPSKRVHDIANSHHVSDVGTSVEGIEKEDCMRSQAWKATGMSRPIAADGTIRYSTLSALACATFGRHASTAAASAARTSLIAVTMGTSHGFVIRSAVSFRAETYVRLLLPHVHTD